MFGSMQSIMKQAAEVGALPIAAPAPKQDDKAEKKPSLKEAILALPADDKDFAEKVLQALVAHATAAVVQKQLDAIVASEKAKAAPASASASEAASASASQSPTAYAPTSFHGIVKAAVERIAHHPVQGQK